MLFSLAGILLAVSCNLAAAQEPSGESWQTTCNDKRCVISRRLVEQTTKRPFLTFSLSFEKDSKEPLLALIAPLGIALQPGIRVIVNARTLDVPVRVCYPDGCQAARPVSEDEIALLRSSAEADVRFFVMEKSEPLAARVDLKGLANAIDSRDKK